jgi:cytochrome b subunit of formate dehydrogenase
LQGGIVKRFLKTIIPLVLGFYLVTVSTVFAQGGTLEGFPPQSVLFNDAVLFARVLLLFVAVGIGFGIWRAQTSLREPVYSPGSPVVTRHDLGTVITHWVNATGFIVGLITGAIVLRWLPRPDTIQIVFAIHYIAAGMVVFGVASHLTQHGITGGRGLIPRSFKDVREGLGEIVQYAGFFGPESAAFGINLPKGFRKPFADVFVAFGIKPAKQLDKFLPPEKTFSYVPWAIIIGVIVLTGLVKSFRYLYPIPSPFVGVMSVLHDFFAAVSIFMLAFHLSAVLLVPRNWPLLKSMFTTRVPVEYVQERHPIWYARLLRLNTSQVKVQPVSAAGTLEASGK